MANAIKNRRILICDDKPVNYNKLKTYLNQSGFQCLRRVSDAEGVRSAIKKSHRDGNYLDFILLDMDLSLTGIAGHTGSKVYEDVRDEFPNETYIIYSSGFSDETRYEINRLTFRKVPVVLLDNLLSDKYLSMYLSQFMQRSDNKRIFLVHGRNTDKSNKIAHLLEKVFGLEVIRWEEAQRRIGGRKYILDTVIAGIEMSHMTLVLFTDDEDVTLIKKYRESESESKRSRQARANVYIEAGYAIGVRPNRTLFVEWPDNYSGFRSPSDFAGIHVVKYSDTSKGRTELLMRLRNARCVVNLTHGWQKYRI